MENLKTFNENYSINELSDFLDRFIAADRAVRDSNYDIKEIKKQEKLEREAMRLGLARRLGSAWYKSQLPKSLHKKYNDAGWTFMEEI
tara:strand:+ start:4424 stop:4687 length:264 start_codon:yes stop_codon:yes gene_type:complete